VAARRGADVSVRLGGDEFALIMYDSTRSGAHQAATQLLHALSRPIETQFGTLAVSASIGIALYPDDAGDIEALLLKADAAMYHAKRSGRNCVAFASLL
jgi:diguanylate cyclase (GGDEF)-like protein